MGGTGWRVGSVLVESCPVSGFDQKAFSIHLLWLHPVVSFEVSVEFPFLIVY